MHPAFLKIQQGERSSQRTRFHTQLMDPFIGRHSHPMTEDQLFTYYEAYRVGMNEINFTHNFLVEPLLNNQLHPLRYQIQGDSYASPATISQFPSELISTPPLNHPDPYVHYQFLTSLKQHRYYSGSTKVPHNLVSYFLHYLSLEQCPYSKTTLSYIVFNITDFTQSLGEHEIQFLLKVVRKKYPSHISYQTEYQKLVLMDEEQAGKLVELLQILCSFFCQVQVWRIKCNKNESNQNDVGNQYFAWLINYSLVIFHHLEHIKKSSQQSCKNRTDTLLEALQQNKKQILCLLKEQKPRKNEKVLESVSKIIYKSISNEKIMMQMIVKETQQGQYNEWKEIQAYIQIFMQICHERSLNGSFVLIQFVKTYLLGDMYEIRTKIGKVECRISNSEQIRHVFQSYSVRCLNLLLVGPWNKLHKFQIIQMLASCRLLCQLNHEAQQASSEYAELVKESFEMSRCTQSLHKRLSTQKKRQADDLQLSDDW